MAGSKPLSIPATLLVALFLVSASSRSQAKPQGPQGPGQDKVPNPLKQAPNPLKQAPNPLKQAQEPLQKLVLPSFIKPGALLTYKVLQSTESDDPKKAGLAATGYSRAMVIHVDSEAVLFEVTEFVDGLLSRNPAPMGGGPKIFTAKEVAQGNAYWMLPADLKTLKSEEGIQVRRGPFPLHGQAYKSVLVTVQIPNFVKQRAYDQGTGLLLMERSASGRPRRSGNADGFNLKTKNSLYYETYRVLDLPWFQATPPAWTRTVRKMVYRGNMTMFSPGGMPPTVLPREMVFAFKKHEGKLHMGTLTTKTLKNRLGIPESSNKSLFFETPYKVGGLWIPPKVLNSMKQGVLDTDPVLKSTLTYAIQQGNLGKLGVLVESHPSGSYQTILGYDLEDGALRFIQMNLKDMNQQITMTLVDRK
ncbi:MAG TPA: hypothetical protein ENK02_12340 [Planctomycetes bacterium]|nr:hypothetical protein [Planctomycetota bacterium]